MKDFLRKILGQKLINHFHLCQAILANFVYGFPSRRLKVIGVTGTDGKTTTVNLIAKILQEGGHPTSFLSSINAQIGEQTFDTGLHTTTPSPFLLQRLLRKMARAGSQFAVLEVTSHALDQYRTWGIRFETAVLTNITPEHLDYHKTFEEYARAKLKLFRNVKNRVLGESSPLLPSLIKEGKGGFMNYGFSIGTQIWADNIEEDLKSTTFTAHIPDTRYNILLQLPGKFNVLNALAAIALGRVYEVIPEAIKRGLERVKTIPGRMEYIDEGQGFLAMVDFAHTPNALQSLLEFLRPKIAGRIILVFGSAGERDWQKRPAMGAAADKFADLIILTREDNRSEPVEKICNEIASGIRQKTRDRGLFVVFDRREAMKLALSKAQKNDIVVVCGKGHEQSLNIDGKEVPWDDRKVIREELQSLLSFRT